MKKTLTVDIETENDAFEISVLEGESGDSFHYGPAKYNSYTWEEGATKTGMEIMSWVALMLDEN